MPITLLLLFLVTFGLYSILSLELLRLDYKQQLSISRDDPLVDQVGTLSQASASPLPVQIQANATYLIETSASKQVWALEPASTVEAGSGKSFRDTTVDGQDCRRCPEMVVVPAGTFLMGGGTLEPGRQDWQKDAESPRTRIAVDQPFATGLAAVSFNEWEACVADGGCDVIPPDNGWGRGELPVINVTFHEAMKYVSWLSRKTGKYYRLLSEAEREYIARAGTTTPFWFGPIASPKHANYLWDRTMPVKELTPNPWGVFHVHGNINEWTADCWNPSHQGNGQNAAPRATGQCHRRVVKGGSWFNVPGLIRSASRTGLNADTRYQTVGLRVARSIGVANK